MRTGRTRTVRGPLVHGTLRCQLCSRPVGDIVGYARCPLREARFIPLSNGTLPQGLDGQLRCAHCHGQLHLDDVKPLGRSVPLEEVGGLSFADILAQARGWSRPSAV
jgi:hypothetical protein